MFRIFHNRPSSHFNESKSSTIEMPIKAESTIELESRELNAESKTDDDDIFNLLAKEDTYYFS